MIYKLWSSTWRFEVVEPPEMTEYLKNNKPFLLAHWHGDELALISLSKKYKIATITSTSKDGELVNTVLRLLGAKTSRGSSTRGGVGALKGLLNLAKSGCNVSFAVDGPKGPIHQVKAGVFEFSRVRNFEIFCAGLHCENAIRFPKSWNQTYFPKPFAKISLVWRGPVESVSKEQDPRDTNLAEDLRNQLFAAQQSAGKLFAETK